MNFILKRKKLCVFLAFLIFIGIVYYLYLWFLEYDSNKDNKSIIINNMQVINDNELDTYLIENKDAIIYISNADKSKTRSFDRKFNKLILQYNISKKILYLNVDKNNFVMSNATISVPSIVIYENQKIKDSYDIDKNNYNISELKQYLTDNGVIDND